ncbi:MAG: hypothetical protein C0404_05890 [Verrucomicrobia bacterium]|nr:hypothetical protein [Verrucomicrobiota bacterium]
MKSRNLVFVVAHPDDLAHGMGGTCCLLRGKYKLHVICATKGERGVKGKSHSEAAAIREKEEAAVCKALGASLTFLGRINGDLFADQETCQLVASKLKKLNPLAVFSLWPVNRHPDHVSVYAIAVKALELAGLTDKAEFYMCEGVLGITNQFVPDILVDISSVADEKRSFARMHRSQNPTEDRVERVMSRNVFRGKFIGCEYAEAFKTLAPLSVGGGNGRRWTVLGNLR